MYRSKSSVARRWGIPFDVILLSIATQSLTLADAARIVGLSYQTVRNAANAAGIRFNSSQIRADVYKLTGMRFSEAVKSMADAGLNRQQAHELLGFKHYATFLSMIENRDPFPPVDVASQYLHDTGQTVVAGARYAAAQGMYKEEAARFLGYSTYSGLRGALERRGVEVEFKKREPKRKPPREKRFPKMPPSGNPHPWRRNFLAIKQEQSR